MLPLLRYLGQLLILASSTIALAQPLQRVHTTFTEEDGLAQNFVYSIIQDAKGFLWVSTGNGLSRFDGHTFVGYTKQHGLAGNFITASFETSSHQLIFGHYQGGITHFNGTSFRQISGDSTGSEITSIGEDIKHRIWLASKSTGLLRLNTTLDSVIHYFPPELQGKLLYSIQITGSLLLAATNEGLYTFHIDPDKIYFVDSPEALRFQEITALSLLPHDTLTCWAGTSNGSLYRLHLGTSTKTDQQFSALFPTESSITFLKATAPDKIWISATNEGLSQYTLTNKRQLIQQQDLRISGLPSTTITTCYIDQDLVLWSGTSGQGLIKSSVNPFRHFDLRSFGVEQIYATAPVSHGYLAATDKGLFSIAISSKAPVTRVSAFGAQPVISLLQRGTNAYWVGTENNGIYAFTYPKTAKPLTLHDAFHHPLKARLFKKDKSNQIWISAIGQGVYQTDTTGKILQHFATETGFIHNDIFALYPDSKGNTWFGSQGAGLAMLSKDGVWKLFSQEGSFPSRDVNDISEDATGTVWIATDGQGCFRYINNSFQSLTNTTTTSTQPLYVKGITPASEGGIWLSYRKGFNFLNLNTGKTRAYTPHNGLPDSDTYTSSPEEDQHGQVRISTTTGITTFPSILLQRDIVLHPCLNDVRLFFDSAALAFTHAPQRDYTQFPTLHLPHDRNHLTFHYNAVSLNYPGPIYYRYQVSGIDPGWSPPTQQTTVTYPALPPGSYTLHIQATHDLQYWSNPELNYSFIIEKPYWNRAWFYILQVELLLLLFSITFYLSRTTTTKIALLRILVFTCLFLLFEYLQNWLDPISTHWVGQVPLYKSFLNLLLALLLLPVERLLRRYFIHRFPDSGDWE